jgi:hypothetical protein
LICDATCLYRPPTQSQNPKTLLASMPKSVHRGTADDAATMCCLMIDSADAPYVDQTEEQGVRAREGKVDGAVSACGSSSAESIATI